MFVARIENLFAPIPTRTYVHEGGAEVFGTYFVDGADEYVRHIFHKNPHVFDSTFPDFAIAALWGDENNRKIAEFFGYKGTGRWPGNPDVYSWVFRDGVYQSQNLPGQRLIGCGETMILLGREEEYRQTTKSLEDYLLIAPDLGELMRRF